MENKIKVIAGVILGLLAGSLGTYTFNQPSVVEKIVYENVTVEVPVEVPVEKIVNITEIVEVPINVTQIVEVDNGNLNTVLEHIYNNNGTIEYITSTLKNDEINLITDRIILVNEFKSESIKAIESELFAELDKFVFNATTTFDEAIMERLRVNSGFEEINITSIDFINNDSVVTVSGTFEQESVKYAYTTDVVFKDSVFDKLSNINVVLN